MSGSKLHNGQGTPHPPQQEKSKTLTGIASRAPEVDRLPDEAPPQAPESAQSAQTQIEEQALDPALIDKITARLASLGYTYIEFVGMGGMSSIHRAREEQLELDLAVKVISGNFFRDDEARELFNREGKILAKLKHPNLPFVYAQKYEPDDKYAFIVQEFLHGKTMEDIVDGEGPIDPKKLRHLFAQACEGLQFAHKKGIVHRDIKPGNLFVMNDEEEEHLKVIDFGIAKMTGNLPAKYKATSMDIIKGTPDYMSPEQISNKALDGRSDIYSLGTAMYEMLTGTTPFPREASDTPNAGHIKILNRVLSEMPETPRQRRPDLSIPEDLEAIIMRCLAKDPNDRFQSMDELRTALLNSRMQVEMEQVELEDGEETDFTRPDQLAVMMPQAEGFEAPVMEALSSLEAPSDPDSPAGTVFRPLQSDDGVKPTRVRKDSLVGKVLGGKYLIEERIGGGGMGAVYRAKLRYQDGGHVEAFEKTVAVKVMNPTVDDESRRIDETRFIREATVAAELNHPNIAGVLDFGRTDDNRQFYVIEYLQGSDLHSVIYNSPEPMSIQRFFSMASQICDGLHAAHTYKEPIVHRDIKPPNIFIDNRHGKDTVKILDFGLAKIKNEGTQLTAVGNVLGTFEYMPPEQISGKKTDDPRVDIYAAGITFYEMLCWKRPFDMGESRDYGELKKMITTEYPPEPITIRPDIPKELSDIVMKCLRKNPDERFGTMKELGRALGRVERKVVPRPALSSMGIGYNPQPGVLPPAAQTAVPQNGGAQNQPAWLAQPAVAGEIDAAETEIRGAPKRRKKSAMVIGASALAAAVILGGVAYVGLGRQPDKTGQSRSSPTEPLVDSSSARPVEQPQTRPSVPTSVIVPTPQPTTHSIRFNVRIEGVEVRRGEETACTTSAQGSCSVSLPSGSEPVVFTFRKQDYRETQVSVVPDSDRGEEVHLEREERTRPPRTRPTGSQRPPQGSGQRTHPPVITTPD
jgi:serine/threonine-protein kinase